MANTFNTNKNAPGIIAAAAAQMLSDELQFTKSIAKAPEEDYKGKNGYAAGDTVYISQPARFVPQSTFDITSTKQDIVETKVPLTLDIISTVGVEITSLEHATEIEIQNVLKRVIKPAVSSMAQDVETKMLQKATRATANAVGNPGSTVFDTDMVLSARERVNKYLCPKDDERYFLFDSTAGRSAVNARKGLFQSSANIAEQYKSGLVGMADGFNWMENELLYTHTNGNDVTGVAVAAAVLTPATGASQLGVNGLTNTTGTVTVGSTFTIAGVFAVHPITKKVYPFLQKFTVTANATANGSGQATLSISPTIYSSASGALQNVSALPADTAALVFDGVASTAYSNSLAFHKEAFRMVSVPLIMPKNVELAAQETVDGITVAIVRAFDVNKRSMITRLDFLGGLAATRPEWACRVIA